MLNQIRDILIGRNPRKIIIHLVPLSAAEVEIVEMTLRRFPQGFARNQESDSMVPDLCGNAITVLSDYIVREIQRCVVGDGKTSVCRERGYLRIV